MSSRIMLLCSDHLGSVIGPYHRYDPYGFCPVQPGSRLAFTGQLPEFIELHYLLGSRRVYNVVLKRFQSCDSLSPFEKGGLNGYIYGGGDPVNGFDLTGQSWIPKAIKRLFGSSPKPRERENPMAGSPIPDSPRPPLARKPIYKGQVDVVRYLMDDDTIAYAAHDPRTGSMLSSIPHGPDEITLTYTRVLPTPYATQFQGYREGGRVVSPGLDLEGIPPSDAMNMIRMLGAMSAADKPARNSMKMIRMLGAMNAADKKARNS